MDIQGFMNDLALDTQSRETLRAYRQTLEKYEAFLRSRRLRVTQAKPSTIREFLQHMAENHGRLRGDQPSKATVAQRLAILSSFYEYLGRDSDGEVRNPVDRVKRPKVENNLPRAVERNVLTTLLTGIPNQRDVALLLTFLCSGLRLSELCSLDIETIVPRNIKLPNGKKELFGEGEVVGKGQKRRRVQFGAKALIAIKAYMRVVRKGVSEGPLFVSSRGTRISPRAIEHLLAKWCKRLGLPHIHPHQLRHSFATLNVDAGISVEALQSLLGHANPATCGRYFRVKRERCLREYFSVAEYLNRTAPELSPALFGTSAPLPHAQTTDDGSIATGEES